MFDSLEDKVNIRFIYFLRGSSDGSDRDISSMYAWHMEHSNIEAVFCDVYCTNVIMCCW